MATFIQLWLITQAYEVPLVTAREPLKNLHSSDTSVYLRVHCGEFLHENFTTEDSEVHRGEFFKDSLVMAILSSIEGTYCSEYLTRKHT
jgi:hypothetical protein